MPDVWACFNHNWLRLTRVLEAQALYDRLEALCRSGKFPIPLDTLQCWTEAVQGLPFHA